MNHLLGTPARMVVTAMVVLLLVAGGALAFLSLSSVEHLASGSAEKTIVVECDFEKFRQIMVRKNATAAIVGQSGMTLIDERVEDLQVDTSQDDRPLLNAIRGRSKTDVQAVKKLRVSLNDPHIAADELTLRQRANVHPDGMDVVTESIAAAANLDSYRITLDARPKGTQTEVTLTVALDVRVTVPKAFTGRADREVQQSAVEAVSEQATSLQRFVAEHAGERFILPELGGGSD
ncbi:putative transmembrane region and signal peptide protein [Rhodopirellula islandica]|uniref:Transmembrane region and signal peptide protein n=1 Tax=Rhodopirellula islandica TaxID=595434 RepID=A0A0J1BLG0_RHOIS|nr:hypothetical protein [Rhodopirellula islandica]KLU07352.1 putative transmembrane region and signal peptide protein [Rhodopirellula islandica]